MTLPGFPASALTLPGFFFSNKFPSTVQCRYSTVCCSLVQRLERKDRCLRAFSLLSTGQIKNCAGILSDFYIMHYFDQSATSKLTHVFLVVGWWATVDFDSKYKVLLGETRAHGYLFMKKQS